MFFSKKRKNLHIDCVICCLDRESQYSFTVNEKNLCTYVFKFDIVIPEHLSEKILYEYTENPNLYQVDKFYKIKLNIQTGEFTIIGGYINE